MSTTRSYKNNTTVIVGVDDKSDDFVINTSLLMNHSDFFRAALNSQWLEGCTNTVNLPDDDPASFQIFAHWLYYKVVDLKQVLFNDEMGDPALRIETLLPCWIMGDKLGASAFRNGVIDLLVTTYKESPRLPTLEHIDYVYQNTHPGARLRTLLVGFTAWYMTEPSNNLSSRPAEFVSACFNTFVEAVTEQG